MSAQVSSRNAQRGRFEAAAYQADTYALGGWGSPDPNMHTQGNDASNSWIVHPNENAWIRDTSWCPERPEDEKLEYVDMLGDIIPFWLQEVAAAERGEKLRYDQFLEDLREEREKRLAAGGWGLPIPDWAAGSPTNEQEKKSSVTDHLGNSAELKRSMHEDFSDENADEAASETSLDRDDFNFVEKVARLNGISPSRKKEMRRFYKISTAEKVKQIENLIESLRGH